MESFGLRRWFDQDRIVYDDGRFANKVDMFRFAADVIGVPSECFCFVLPAILSWVFCEILRKMGWIKEGDLKLDL